MRLKGIFKKITSHFNNVVLVISTLVFIFFIFKLGLYFVDHISARTANTLASAIYYKIDKGENVSGETIPVDLIGRQGNMVISIDANEDGIIKSNSNQSNASIPVNNKANIISAPIADPTDKTDDPGGSSDNEPEPRKINQSFLELLKINEDITGWIKIPDTKVDYPIVQGTDNDFYLKRNHEKKESRYGSIFMDFRNNFESLDKNTILYGHHMADGMMFNNVAKYKQRKFFESHPYIFFSTLYDELKWEVFSVYVTDVNFDYIRVSFDADNDFLEFVDVLKEKSIYETDITLDSNDIILTLSTCSYEFENARTVVHAKLLEILE